MSNKNKQPRNDGNSLQQSETNEKGYAQTQTIQFSQLKTTFRTSKNDKVDQALYLKPQRIRLKSQMMENRANQTQKGKSKYNKNIMNLTLINRSPKFIQNNPEIPLSKMPTIHQMTRQRDKIFDIFTKAQNRYKYTEMVRQKKWRNLSMKKQKCQRIKKIREDNSREKQLMNLSKMQIDNQYLAQKIRLKNSVVEQKKRLSLSVYETIQRKQAHAQQIKQLKQHQSRLKELQLQKQIQRKRNLHAKIVAAHKQQKNKKISMLQTKKRVATQNYSSKIFSQYRTNQQLQNKNYKLLPKYQVKVRQYSIQAEKLQNDVQDYDRFLLQA